MKKLVATFVALFVSISIFAQAPQSFNYQGLARDNSGNALISQSISIKASILDGSPAGTVVYSEILAATTNQFGLFTTAIGTGTVTSGTFSGIAWSTGNKYLKIEMDPTGGSNYALSGTTQLLSVPYAMYATSSGNGSSQWQNNPTGINYSVGNVGIGTSTPNHALEIVANETNGLLGFADKRHLLHIQNTNSGSLSNVAAILTAGPLGTTSGLSIGHTAPSYSNGPNVSSVLNVEGAGLTLGTWGSVAAPINFAIGTPSNFVMTIANNGYVGIGTTTPTSSLHTIGTIRLQGLASNNLLTTALVTDASGNIYTKDISSLGTSQWQNNPAGINYNAGYVGIGTNNPGVPLNIQGNFTGSARNTIELNNINSGTDGFCGIGISSASDRGVIAMYSSSYFPTDSNLNGFTGRLVLNSFSKGIRIDAYNTSGSISFATGGNYASNITSLVRMTIDPSGNVGIGTTNPTSVLHTNGTVRFQGLASNNLLTTALVTDASGNIFTKDISSLGNNLWQTNAVGINYIGGKVGIGTSSPTYYLDVEYSATGSDRNGMLLKNTSQSSDNNTQIILAGGDNFAGFANLTYFSKNYTTIPGVAGTTTLAAVGGKLSLQSLGGDGIEFTSSPQYGSLGIIIGKFATNGNFGLGTETPTTKLHVASGDVYIDDATKGIIMKNSGGQCYRVTVGATGTLVSTLIACP